MSGRLRPLPQGTARGHLVLPEALIAVTRRYLQQSCGDDGRHEGLALLAGRLIGPDTYVLGVIGPRTHHERFAVHIDEAAVGAAARAARSLRTAIVAQVHSHPGRGTHHSDGDDDIVLMPFEGMFSLVIGGYGRGSFDPAEGAGLHQYQDGRWVYIHPHDGAMVIVPSLAVAP